MKKRAYSQKEVEKRLKDVPEWKTNTKCTSLARSFKTSNFVAGLALVAKITVHAEVMDHHPTVELSYGMVKITLSTHDVDGLTKKDFELAERIDRLQHTKSRTA